MNKKKFVAGAHAFGVKNGDKVEAYAFVVSSFIFNGQRFETEALFDGEQMKPEHAEMAAELVRIQAGVIEKSELKSAEASALDTARAEYESVTGNKPGNKKLETLLKEIEEAKAKKD